MNDVRKCGLGRGWHLMLHTDGVFCFKIYSLFMKMIYYLLVYLLVWWGIRQSIRWFALIANEKLNKESIQSWSECMMPHNCEKLTLRWFVFHWNSSNNNCYVILPNNIQKSICAVCSLCYRFCDSLLISGLQFYFTL